mmetsp:Transcript_8571/g.9557  ORF Transcript_8571/g.9557 Transcript_8571/m.9557 type:complete len:233 (-) Transcript_8571:157-855(-)
MHQNKLKVGIVVCFVMAALLFATVFVALPSQNKKRHHFAPLPQKVDSFTTLRRKLVFSVPGRVEVERHAVILPDGEIEDNWLWVLTPSFVNIMALTEDNKVIIFKQEKYATDGFSLAAPGGHVEPGEESLPAAKRELVEETGYASDEWHFLGEYTMDANRGVGKGYLYLALDAKKVQEKMSEGDVEKQEMMLLTLEELEEAILDNKMQVLSWSATMTMGLMKLKQLQRTRTA